MESLAQRHENYSADWWTPPGWLAWARETLGGELFDPCPGDWDPTQPGGLDIDWGPLTYCNHPGSRGSTAAWWAKAVEHLQSGGELVWCAFSVEQLRHMRPCAMELPGWLVMPRDRVRFIWGGPTMSPRTGKPRIYGEPVTSPGNWTVFWSSCRPAMPPTESLIVPTGGAYEMRGES